MFRHFKFVFTHIRACLLCQPQQAHAAYYRYHHYIVLQSRLIFYYNNGYLAYSILFCLICTSQVLKHEMNKAFYIFDRLKVLLRLDDTSPTCTYLAKHTAENAMLQKSTLQNAKCKFKFNILIQSQKPDLVTYLKEEGIYTKVPYFLSFKFETEVYLYFCSF